MLSLLHEFGNYLSVSFNKRNLDQVVPLKYELDLVRSYIYIEQQRFSNKLKVEWDIEEELEVNVPPLSIQPLVENAIKHGVLKRPNGGKVTIQATEFEKYIEFSISDDGVGMTEEKRRALMERRMEASFGIGIANTNKRLAQLYGRGLDIISPPNLGTTIRFRIWK